MNLRQQRFITEYLKDGNATQAAVRAGYSRKAAYAQGSRVMENAEVRRELSRHIERELVTTNEVIDEVRKSAFTPLKTKAVKDKLRALELLGKYLKLWGDEKSVQVDVNVNLAQIRADLLGMETKPDDERNTPESSLPAL